jgi:hypothetical protein
VPLETLGSAATTPKRDFRWPYGRRNRRDPIIPWKRREYHGIVQQSASRMSTLQLTVDLDVAERAY